MNANSFCIVECSLSDEKIVQKSDEARGEKTEFPFAINADHHFYDYEAEKWISKYKDLFNTIFM